MRGAGAYCSMRRVAAAFACSLALCGPAMAIVGGALTAEATFARRTVMVLSSRGACTGAVLARDLVLTAAHCVVNATNIRIGGRHTGKMFHLAEVTESAPHPHYGAGSNESDLALLKLSKPLSTHAPAFYQQRIVAIGDRLTVIGYGTTTFGDRKTEDVPRMAMLVVTYQSRRVIYLTDRTNWSKEKISGCGGDSGAPIFAARSGVPMLVAILRGSSRDCDNITVATPLAPHHDWIMETAKKLGAPLEP